MTSSTAGEKDPKPLAIRGPLALIGVVMGLLAAGIIVPGCSFGEDQVERLHVGLPIAMPIALVLAATWLGKRLAPKLMEPKRRWIWFSLAMTLAGETMFNFAASVLYQKQIAVDWLVAFMFFWPLHVALFPTALLIVGAAREVTRVRSGSLVAGVLQRQVWLVPLGVIAPLVAVTWLVQVKATMSFAYATGAIAAAAIPMMAIFLVLDGRALKRVTSALEATQATSRDDAIQALDLGVGDDLRVADVEGEEARGYRESARRGEAVRGAPQVARQIILRAGTRTAIALCVGIVAAVISAQVLPTLRPPTPEELPHIDFPPLNRC